MASVIKAGNATDGVQVTSDNTGILELKTGTGSGTTAVTVGTGQDVTFAQAANLPNTFGFKNRIINGDMRIDQRNAGASVSVATGANVYTVDRWAALMAGANTFTVQRSSVAPAGFTNSALITAGTGATGSYGQFQQRVEGFNVSDLAWGTASAQTVTISFKIRSSLTGTFSFWIRNGAQDRQYNATYTINAANTWEDKTITIPGDTSGTWATDNSVAMYVTWDLAGVGAGSAGSWGATGQGVSGTVGVLKTTGATFYITGVQLEKGSTATSFDYRPYGTELQLCQRYYYRITPDNGKRFGSGFAYSTTEALLLIPFMTEMRSVPSALEQTGTATDYRLLSSTASGLAGTAVPTFNSASKYNAAVLFTVGSGLVAGNGTIGFAHSASAYLGFNAEL